jgi:stalled ribosome rescue protein Dom34
MARRTNAPKAEAKGARTHRATATLSGEGRVSAEAEVIAAQEIDRIIERLDVGIAEEKKAMDALLSRLRTTRIAT